MPLLLALALLGCATSPTPGEGAAPSLGDSGTAEEDAQPDWSEEIETVPGRPGAEDLFVDDRIHPLHLQLTSPAIASLRAEPRTWVEATLTTEEGSFLVGVRLKGNTSMDSIDGKPAFKVDVNRYVEGQTVWEQPSFYLQNMLWDPSYLHEFLTYGWLQEAEVPAARAAYATLGLNDADYGLYLILEKQSGAFMRERFGDDGGSIYESGSFNHPCDLQSGPEANPCTCFEVDHEGSADTFADLQALCTAARASDALDTELGGRVDLDLFRRGQAAEMVVSHYDNYGWNTNNWRLAHLPETGRWIFTPWSADLSWGWYPWMSGPHCGTYGVTPTEYQSGFLVWRCWADPDCAAAMGEELLELADLYESLDMPARLAAARELIEAEAVKEYRGYYGPSEFHAEADCLEDYVESRPGTIRDWVGANL